MIVKRKQPLFESFDFDVEEDNLDSFKKELNKIKITKYINDFIDNHILNISKNRGSYQKKIKDLLEDVISYFPELDIKKFKNITYKVIDTRDGFVLSEYLIDSRNLFNALIRITDSCIEWMIERKFKISFKEIYGDDYSSFKEMLLKNTNYKKIYELHK